VRWINNLKIQNKLMLMFMMIIFVSAISLGWNIWQAIRIGRSVHQLYLDSEARSLLRENREHFSLADRALSQYLEADRHESLALFRAMHSQVEEGVDFLLWMTETTEESGDMLVLEEALEAYTTAAEGAIIVGLAGDEGELAEASLRLDESRAGVERLYQSLIDTQSFYRKGEMKLVSEMVWRTAYVGIAGLLALVAMVVLAAMLTNQVAERMLYLTNAVVSFENNTYEEGLLEDFKDQRDETGQLARAITNMACSIILSMRRQEVFLQATSRFVPGQYLDFLEKTSIVDIYLGDHVSAEMAVMFSDIRGFTTMSETMTPQENFDFVNEYLALVSPRIQAHEGFIVKFLGDGMMAIFPYGVDDAIIAGIEKKKLVRNFNRNLAKRNMPPIDVGIGIHTGHMMVGMIGEEDRIQGDAFSDSVNLTSRVEGLTKFYGVSMLITEEALMRVEVRDRYQLRFMGKALVKGKRLPLSLYEVMDEDPEEILRPKLETKAEFDQGLKAYLAGRFDRAKASFKQVLEGNPRDLAAAFYLHQCETRIREGTPDTWDGVVVMTSK
jgi:class 3 adenylate cyclase